MKTLTLRNVPEDLMRLLGERATAHGRTVQQEALALLERARGLGRNDALTRARTIRERLTGRTLGDGVRELREARDKVHAGPTPPARRRAHDPGAAPQAPGSEAAAVPSTTLAPGVASPAKPEPTADGPDPSSAGEVASNGRDADSRDPDEPSP